VLCEGVEEAFLVAEQPVDGRGLDAGVLGDAPGGDSGLA